MNRHVKTINGRKYYYKSVRKGDKVTSEYIGPVDRVRRKKAKAEKIVMAEGIEEETAEKETTEDENTEEEDYIG